MLKKGYSLEMIIIIIGAVTAIITITLTNFFAKRNQLKFEERKLKEEYYITFIRAISDSVILPPTEEII